MKISIRKITFAAVVAAIYAALTMLLAPISYGAVQFRIAEVLCILPFFFPTAVWGLFVGCILANLISAFGVIDVVFGSLATLLAGLCTMFCGRYGRGLPAKILACFAPVAANGLVVGAVIAYASAPGDLFWGAYAVNGLWVALGEFGVLFVLGLPLLLYLPRTALFRKMLRQYDV